MVNKLYKYRPLSDFLFKELYYSELYSASYAELNDPLDLTATINFRTDDAKQLEYLIYSLNRISIFPLFEDERSGKDINISPILIEFSKNFELRAEFCKRLFKKLNNEANFISYEQIEEYIKPIAKEYGIDFRYDAFKKEIDRLTNVFFQNSYAICFSETHTDFLMWSHYASKHQGVCMEFTMNGKDKFPFIITSHRKIDKEKYLEMHSVWERKSRIFWCKVKKIDYKAEIPTINYYDFAPVFENEGDCDLMGLSKSKWHGFAFELEKVFCQKKDAWDYEKEWRAIEINFGKIKHPEERIKHYPIEALTGIYFGLRTPENVKERIFRMINRKNPETDYYEAKLSDNRNLYFTEWYSEGE